MAIVRFEPAREVDTFQRDFGRFFDAFFGGDRGVSRRWMPAMDLVESDEHLILRADLPGMRKDDVTIEIKDGVLEISGERKAESEDESTGYYRVERTFGSFSRSLTLPDGIDAEAVDAEFTDGVLEVRIPKPAERQPHRVEIGGSTVDGSATEK